MMEGWPDEREADQFTVEASQVVVGLGQEFVELGEWAMSVELFEGEAEISVERPFLGFANPRKGTRMFAAVMGKQRGGVRPALVVHCHWPDEPG
jgi:hypothetical protein